MNEDFIFQAKKEGTKIQQASDQFYTLKGLSETTDSLNNCTIEADSENVFAKKIFRSDGSVKFYIRTGNNGNIYNTVSIYGEEKVNTFLDRVCKDGLKFREVNEKVFAFYLKFLNTQNIAWLHNAEREII
jgi:hypothetical protein